MPDSIESIRLAIEAETLDSEDQIEAFRVKYLGRKSGLITNLFAEIRVVEASERKAFGQAVNAVKLLAESRLEEARAGSQAGTDQERSDDVTLPGRQFPAGSLHPITQTAEEIKKIFAKLGYAVVEGPEIEDDYHNFSALNFPPNHPARDMQDTLFLEEPPPAGRGILLRTHTSPLQIRVMESGSPPFRVIVPGRVYRNEAISYKSYCLFNQVEGLCIDDGITFADLKETLRVFAFDIFGGTPKMRFRPSFFPFTEPSAEVDIWWEGTDGKEGHWLEILGCGMVDPNVLESVDVDPERYTGFAFGMGVERIAMLRHGITDIRLLYENDIRFLEQF
jgi:phenylalanyl-tRNA synthetase alpha chain